MSKSTRGCYAVISKKEYKTRRQRLMDMIGSNSIAILPTSPVYFRNRDVEFPFRPDSDFYYLTGYIEPEAIAVLIPDRKDGEFILFCRDSDANKEIWHGRRAALEGARSIYGADDAFPIEDLDDILPGLIEGHDRVFYNMGQDVVFDNRILAWVNQIRSNYRAGAIAPEEFISLNHFLHDMRLYKSKSEIQLMRKGANISSDAHKHVMQVCKPGMYEYQIEAVLAYDFTFNGAQALAYPSIVGGGANSCVLHYIENKDKLTAGDLLLVDAGAEYYGYASDITRTFPVNGEYNKEQRKIYDIVLAAQLAAIEQVKPGNNWNAPHEAAVQVLTEGLVEIGVLKGKVYDLIKNNSYAQHYMHRTGHWLGMDVHDVGDYKLDNQWRMLEPGMVLTIEPGLYFPVANNLARKWWNIGVRIEDDVLVTKHGCDILSKDAPKKADDIMELMSHAS